ncbi:alpha-glucoside-specific PTS transporter subunit IIBC [Loigolactobacillus coryniformis]|uniref:alpha-glucoside-specific PTS transporter subunit IIBC n=1 Tax=Loigolactobacillus coryniformis TaxID=1610 RepID=UPI00233FA8F2|nr:alpha-glucoside-specific PTS transporter subunit IIBC [Loigolactobacillus coryniformis]MDC4186480.1 alpha-glucoside-specific PTS transporter subunit IIBC [Loigolactobacillus coryniformis]
MMQKVQRFGAAMFTPVLLFAFGGTLTAICVLMTNETIFGSLAGPTTMWTGIWKTLQAGAFTIFNIIPLLFAVGLPIGLAKKAAGRAAMESVVIYAAFNYLINSMLTYWGSTFGVKNFVKTEIIANSTNQGLTNILGIKTLDTSILGALVVAGVTVWLHNKYFDKKLPDWLGTFQGSTYIVMLGTFAMIPLALLTCLFWPKVQIGIGEMQHFIKASGIFGIWLYHFLERFLIPTGLHHFIYIPFAYGPAAIAGGIHPWWFAHLNELAASTRPMAEIAPMNGFTMYGNDKVFGILGVCLAFYMTARSNKKKTTLALLIPAGLTALLAGITEPVEFTFLFVAPPLWLVYSLLCATMDAVMVAFGVVGDFGGGLIGFLTTVWIPLWQNHWITWVTQIAIGLIFTAIIYFTFVFMIKRFNYLTPGREADTDETRLITKKEYKAAQAAKKNGTTTNVQTDPYMDRAKAYLDALGGTENIDDITSCATRLRVTVSDEKSVAPDANFKANKAVGVVHHGKALQVIVGLDVPQVLTAMQEMMGEDTSTESKVNTVATQYADAAMFSDSLGTETNIIDFTADSEHLTIKVKDTSMVDNLETFKTIGLGVTNISITGNSVTIKLDHPYKIADGLDNIIQA